ncbi:cysteine hydrolase family protein [Herbaspirillum sp.]|uniref:cysteine hydrolase family protein n=1 Tax=Herbaspirillum sp. TaxID=1890675 RepID=UPI001B03E727|nr:cysteine hydrolase family protein [Herbaspirillum sp.]MBO9536266.1 cysteine hydrolase [Herbaspirillum sp.]
MPTALLIIDVQHALCAGPDAVAEPARVIAAINLLSQRARAADVPVICVQHEDNGEMAHGSTGWQLVQGLETAPQDVMLRKRGSDAFHQTELQSMLKMRHISHLVVCGMQTEFCVESTVRRALALGYPVTLADDAHTTAGDGVLEAAQIIAHHNTTLSRLGAYGVRTTLMAAQNISFG